MRSRCVPCGSGKHSDSSVKTCLGPRSHIRLDLAQLAHCPCRPQQWTGFDHGVLPRREEWAAKVPMPSILPLIGPRVPEAFVLQPGFRQADLGPVAQQSRSLRRHQVCHGSSLPIVAMQPQAAVHRMYHTSSTGQEFSICWHFR
jgi:hypothetical protein